MKKLFSPRHLSFVVGWTVALAALFTQFIRSSNERTASQPISAMGTEPATSASAQVPAPDIAVASGRGAGLPTERVVVHRQAGEAPPWATAFGKEFWRRPVKPDGVGPERRSAAQPAPVNLDDVVERVSHAFTREAGSDGPRLEAKTFSATLDGEGLRFSPHRAALEPDPQTEARFRTVAVRSGGRTLFQSGGAAVPRSVVGNTAQALLNGDAGLIEHYEARSGGVEVCWVFQRGPTGGGPLEIEAEVQGLSYAAKTEHGHHFADMEGMARVRIGPATLVDARGARTEVSCEVTGDTLRVQVSPATLAAVEFPIAIDPLLSPEFGMDEPVLSFSLEAAQDPAIASNGSEYLVVWADSRVPEQGSVFGTRVSGTGALLDPRGRLIAASSGGVLYPAVASNGRDYLVAWRSGYTGGTVLGTRVTSAGVPLDTNSLLQIGSSSAHPRPAIASDGTNYLVVWEHPLDSPNGDEDILAARVSNDGRVLDSPSLTIRQAPGRQRGPAVACNGSVFLVVWNDDMEVAHSGQTFAARVTGNGVVLDPDGFLVGGRAPGTFPTPAVASNGRDFLVAGDGVATRVSADGNLMGSVSLGESGIPAVASNGRDYLVAQLRTATIRAVLVSGDGVVLASAQLASTDRDYFSWTRPAVASAAGDFFAVWDDRNLSNGRIFGARVTGAGSAAMRDIPISTDFNAQLGPAVACNGSDYLVVWSDYRVGTFRDIFGVRVGATGTVLDPAGLPIRRGTGLEEAPAVASNGRDYFVAWQEYRPGGNDRWHLFGGRVTSAGAVLDPEGVPISVTAGNAIEPAVASNGRDYLVAWVDWSRPVAVGWDIYAARVTADAVVLDTNGFVVSSTSRDEFAPAVASDGRDYLVAWADFYPGLVAATRVTSAGVVSTPNGTLLRNPTNEATYPFPSVAFNGRDYFVVWHENGPFGTTDIRGTRLSTDGAPLDSASLTICSAPGRQVYPSVASAGGDFLVAWSDKRNARSEIFGARVTGAGRVIDRDGFLIAETGSRYDSVVALAGNGRNFLAAYNVMQDGSLYRVRGRFITVPPCPPRIEWQASFGTSRDDRLISIRQTADGGYILGGWSNGGVDGDKSEPNFGHYDYWVVRLNASGAVVWDRTFGGDGAERLIVVRQTADGGFIIGGDSYLGRGGNQESPSLGGSDFWIIRLDANGTKIWERSFGGSDGELLNDARQTADGGFILGGTSHSGASGNKSATNHGGYDAWVVRTDAEGNKLWDRAFGGDRGDGLTALAQTSDGGFVLAIGSESGISGNKTTPNFDATLGSPDYWLVRLDANGQQLWDRSFGGSQGDWVRSVHQTADGGFVLGGSSGSPADGNKSSPRLSTFDFWVVLVDAAGNKLWDRSYGSAGGQSLFSLELASDGGLLLGGVAFGEPGFGIRDFWTVRTDANGQELWNQRFGGTRNEWEIDLQPTADGGYVFGGHSESGISGNKTTANLGFGDYWVVKLGRPAPDDCDSDGVPDSRDVCADTAVGAVVDANGCSADQRDEDGDGVPESRDLCPHTPFGAVVDANGCSAEQRDSDGDGVPDARDICPGTGPGATVDAHGCSADQLCQPALEWQRTFGSEQSDFLAVIQQTPDGGYIAGGGSLGDFWVVRLDARGVRLWDRFYGGSADDHLTSLAQTRDGGFLLGGWSWSPSGGGKESEHFGMADFWIVRIDAAGNKLWDRSFGGEDRDLLSALQETADGGFILGGASESGISGNKTSPSFDFGDDAADFWVVRLDPDGNKLWEQTFGGSGYDDLRALQQTADGGYILGGSSGSPEESGNKTSPWHGSDDFWIVRLDANGAKLWDRSFGGDFYEVIAAVHQTADGGFLLAGDSGSGPSGNKTSMAFGGGDVWVVRVDASGDKLWERAFGGEGNDAANALAPTRDGGFIIGGWSDSAPGAPGNRTSALPPDGEPIWLVRLDAQGIKLWDQAFPGGPDDDHTGAVQQTADGGFIVGAQTALEDGEGFNDFWVLKLGPEDCDRDGVPDEADPCPHTQPGEAVNERGCSIAQFCPCDGPWRNHGEYVRCVMDRAWEFFRAGRISRDQRQAITREAARSDCGKQRPTPETIRIHLCPQTPEERRRDGIRLVLSGDLAGGCMVESSNDLIEWSPAQTNNTTVIGNEMLIPFTADKAAQFYRARLLP